MGYLLFWASGGKIHIKCCSLCKCETMWSLFNYGVIFLRAELYVSLIFSVCIFGYKCLWFCVLVYYNRKGVLNHYPSTIFNLALHPYVKYRISRTIKTPFLCGQIGFISRISDVRIISWVSCNPTKKIDKNSESSLALNSSVRSFHILNQRSYTWELLMDVWLAQDQ